MKTDWRSNRTGTLQGRTNYKAMKAKDFLKQYKIAMERVEKCRRTYELEMERIDAIGSTLAGDGTPHGLGVSRKTEDKAIRLVDKAVAWHEAEEDALEVLDTVSKLVCSIDGIEGRVLYQRYINLLTWEEVAETLCYSLPGVFNIHRRALDIVDRRLEDEQ